MAKRRTEGRRRSPGGTPAPAAGGALATPSGLALLVAAGAIAIASLVLYVATLAPGVSLVDSGELIVAAAGPGVAHPPGFPLYVLAAHPFTRLPVGSLAWRVNLASATFAAFAAGTIVWVAFELRRGRAQPGTQPGQAAAQATPAAIGVVPLVLVGALFACSRTVWSYATVAEVYTLNTWLLLIVAALALRARQVTGLRVLIAAAAAFGLGLGVHHATLAATLPAVAVLLWLTRRDVFTVPRLARLALVASACAGAVYAYLPLAAHRHPALNWGDPSNFERFWAHVSGRQYSAFIEASTESLAYQARDLARLCATNWGWGSLAVLALALIGFAAAWRRDRPVAAFLAVLLAANVVPKLFYAASEDQDAYFLPGLCAILLAAGLGAELLLGWLVLNKGHRAAAAGVLGLALLPLSALAAHWSVARPSATTVAEDYAADVMGTIGHHGLLLTSDWQVYSPLLYLQGLEGLRPDVATLDLSLLRRSWYLPMLRQRFPSLMESVSSEAAAFEEDLKGWEREPRRYERDALLNRRLTDRYQELILALVAARRPLGRIYATSDVVIGTSSPDPGTAERLTRSYQLVPRGLVFELTSQRGAADLSPLELRGAQLFARPRSTEPGDVVNAKVRPVYLSMVANRGRYLESLNDLPGAADAYRTALTWDPGYEFAAQGLARVASRR